MAKKISRRNLLIATGATGGTLLLGGYIVAELAEPDRAFSDRLLGKPLTQFPQIEVSIPTLTVITTTMFDKFMEQNELYEKQLDMILL